MGPGVEAFRASQRQAAEPAVDSRQHSAVAVEPVGPMEPVRSVAPEVAEPEAGAPAVLSPEVPVAAWAAVLLKARAPAHLPDLSELQPGAEAAAATRAAAPAPLLWA